MLYQAHRGVSTEAPENTLPSLLQAIFQGYDYMETDVALTSDGVFVLLHDNTVNRTARNADGSLLSFSVSISGLSYSQVAQFDYGAYFSPKFKGTALPKLEDILKVASENKIKLNIDSGYQAFTESQKEELFKLLLQYQDAACLTCSTVDAAIVAASRLHDIEINFDGAVDEIVLKQLAAHIEKKRLTVWMPHKTAANSWVKLPFARKEAAKTIRQFARLGIRLIETKKDLQEAEALEADIIETNGTLKPPKNRNLVADMHTHSENSHDSDCLLENMLLKQKELGTACFALTDHCDIYSHKRYDIYTPLVRGFDTVAALNKAQNKVLLLSGVEISEGFWLPDEMKKALSLVPYDVIVGSVHCVRYGSYLMAYSRIDFSAFSKEDIYGYLTAYFNDVKKLIETTDIDILAHLTCPLRYIKGKYEIEVNMQVFAEQITDILKNIINKGIALEVNTSGFAKTRDFFPTVDIIKEYKKLGGYLITLGSDAHIAGNASAYFADALRVLKALGFDNIYYVKSRRFVQCKI